MEYINTKDTNDKLHIDSGNVKLTICRVHYSMWDLFKKHHYLSADLNTSARCFCADWGEKPVAFVAILPQPSGWFKKGWRTSRIVVLPDYQGLGIGSRLSDYFGSLVVADGESRLYIRTVHPAIALHNVNHKEMWQETSHSRKKADKSAGFAYYKQDSRVCYAFRYVGKPASMEEAKLFHEIIKNK